MKFNAATFISIGFAYVLIAAVFLAPSAFAAPHLTIVRGNVYNQSSGNQGIGGLTVTVTCLGTKNKIITRTASTDSFGLYTVHYAERRCKDFSPVTATVTYKGQTQTQTVLISAQSTATLDFYFGSANVPEFSLFTGMAALIGSVGAFFFLRKKNFSQLPV